MAFTEYDGVLFRPPPPRPLDGELWGPLHENREPDRFTGEFYVHPVIRMSVPTLQTLCNAMGELPYETNGGFGDRWIAVLCEKAGVAMVNDRGTYSQNSLDHPDFLARACACVAVGGWGVHGVKHPSMLTALLAARQSG